MKPTKNYEDKIFTFILLLLLFIGGCSQKNVFNWDLTYQSILNEESAEDMWLIEWLGSNTASVKGLKTNSFSIANRVSALNSSQILSGFLIEGPVLHAGEHTALLFLETKNSVTGELYYLNKLGLISKQFPRDVYKKVLAELLQWQQSDAPIYEDISLNCKQHPGYVAILSVASPEETKQIKINFEEYFFNYGGKEEIPGKLFIIWKELAENLIKYGEDVQ
jgi:hypothetical protein